MQVSGSMIKMTFASASTSLFHNRTNAPADLHLQCKGRISKRSRLTCNDTYIFHSFAFKQQRYLSNTNTKCGAREDTGRLILFNIHVYFGIACCVLYWFKLLKTVSAENFLNLAKRRQNGASTNVVETLTWVPGPHWAFIKRKRNVAETLRLVYVSLTFRLMNAQWVPGT